VVRVGVAVAGPLAGAGAQERALALVEKGALVWDRRGRVGERVHEVVAGERGRETRRGGHRRVGAVRGMGMGMGVDGRGVD
jgi:hypothetical protein